MNMKQWLVAVGVVVLCLGGRSAEGGKLDGEGEGLPKLLLVHKDAEAAASLATTEKDDVLAGAAFSIFLGLTTDFVSPDALKTIVRFSEKNERRDRAAVILAFHKSVRKHQAPLVKALAESSEDGARELAAALVATLACNRFINDPALFPSARNDQRAAVPGLKAPQVGVIPDTLFADRNEDTVRLAMIAAAFTGDAAYMPHMPLNAVGRDPVRAGAVLLYHSRQKSPLDIEVALGLAAIALKTPPAMGPGTSSSVFTPLMPAGSLACMGLGQMGGDAVLPALTMALEHQDLRVRIDAVRAIRRVGADESVLRVLYNRISTAPWPELVELCATVGAAPDKRLIPALILRLEKEQGRVRLDLVHALSSIAGEQKGRTDSEWKTWWLANRDTFEVDPVMSKAFRKATRVQDVNIPSLGFFYGLSIFSDRFAYVVDSSGSMKGARITSLRENLIQSLESLNGNTAAGQPKRIAYNIVDFGGDVVSLYKGVLTTNLRDGIKRAETLTLTQAGTRMFDAIDRAMALAELDTIYLLSDGEPILGQLESWTGLIDATGLITLHFPVAIWSVAFDPKGGNGNAMKTLSGNNFGLYETPFL